MPDTVTSALVPGPNHNPLPTASRTLNVLLIEDSEDDALLLLHRFRVAGYQVWSQRVEDERSLREALASRTWDRGAVGPQYAALFGDGCAVHSAGSWNLTCLSSSCRASSKRTLRCRPCAPARMTI
jgi:hypothetical protein